MSADHKHPDGEVHQILISIATKLHSLKNEVADCRTSVTRIGGEFPSPEIPDGPQKCSENITVIEVLRAINTELERGTQEMAAINGYLRKLV